MPAETSPPVRVIILGTDALLSARPATPIQLARACLDLGFALVAPVSWGEELLATSIMESVRDSGAEATVISHCPFVAEALRSGGGAGAPCLFGVAPPAATARYLRGAFAPRALHVTYAGRCPGAIAPDIDACVLPEVLFNRLAEAHLTPSEQPPYFEEQLPPDRARYVSLPGGVPEPSMLLTMTGQHLREGAPATLHAMLPSVASTGRVVIDLEQAVGCVCAHDRFAASQLEPPRATSPVIDLSITVDLTDERLDPMVGRAPRDAQAPPSAHPSPDKDAPRELISDPGVRTEREVERPVSRDAPSVTHPNTVGVVEPSAPRAPVPPSTTAVEPWVPKPRVPRLEPDASAEASPPGTEISATPGGIEMLIASLSREYDRESASHEDTTRVKKEDVEATLEVAREQDSSNAAAPSGHLPASPATSANGSGERAESVSPGGHGGAPVSEYPPLREALSELAREERRAFLQKRTRGVVAVAAALVLIGLAYGTSRYMGWTFARPAMPLSDTMPPRLPALEVRSPANDTNTSRFDSLSSDTSHRIRAPIRRDTAPQAS
jgi:hypothetical protein